MWHSCGLHRGFLPRFRRGCHSCGFRRGFNRGFFVDLDVDFIVDFYLDFDLDAIVNFYLDFDVDAIPVDFDADFLTALYVDFDMDPVHVDFYVDFDNFTDCRNCIFISSSYRKMNFESNCSTSSTQTSITFTSSITCQVYMSIYKLNIFNYNFSKF